MVSGSLGRVHPAEVRWVLCWVSRAAFQFPAELAMLVAVNNCHGGRESWHHPAEDNGGGCDTFYWGQREERLPFSFFHRARSSSLLIGRADLPRKPFWTGRFPGSRRNQTEGANQLLSDVTSHGPVQGEERFLQSGVDAAYADPMGFRDHLSSGGWPEPPRTEKAIGNGILIFPGDQ
jgi:hypothetical protein